MTAADEPTRKVPRQKCNERTAIAAAAGRLYDDGRSISQVRAVMRADGLDVSKSTVRKLILEADCTLRERGWGEPRSRRWAHRVEA